MMKYYEDGDLGSAISRAKLSEADLIQIVKGTLEGIKHAHHAGVIHRDIRPSNILLARKDDGTLTGVLADFDMAYWDNLLFDDKSTTAIPSLVRYVPDDLVRAGRDHPELKAMMRRSSNDVFSVVVVLLDIFASTAESAASGDEDHFSDLLAKANRTFISGQCLSPALRSRIARILAVGLKGRESDRFKSIESLLLAWETGLQESPRQFWVGLGVVLSITITTAFVAEYEIWKMRGTQDGRIMSTIATAISGLSGISFLGWLLSKFSKWTALFTKWRITLGIWLCSTKSRRLFIPLLSLVAPISIVWWLGPQNRFWEYRIIGAGRCRLVDSIGKQLVRIDGNDPRVVTGEDANRLLCPKVTKSGASIYELSIITPAVHIDEEQIDAGVDASQSDDASVASSAGQRVTPEKPPTDEALEEQLLLKVGDSSIRTKLDVLRGLWPRYLGPVHRIYFVPTSPQLHALVKLQNEALDIANGPYKLLDHPVTKNYDFIARKWHALAGHLAALALKCNKGLTYVGDVIRHDGIDNTILWIGDVVRCMSDADQYEAVRTAIQNSPLRLEGKHRFESVLVWLANTQEPPLIQAGVRLRAILLLEILGPPWGDQRFELVTSILTTSSNCEELTQILELIKKYYYSMNDRSKFKQIIAHRLEMDPNLCQGALASY